MAVALLGAPPVFRVLSESVLRQVVTGEAYVERTQGLGGELGGLQAYMAAYQHTLWGLVSVGPTVHHKLS